MNHCRPDEIGYFSFTVKAAEEIRDRVTKEEWSEDELKKMYPYFCTLHSLAYKRSTVAGQSDRSWINMTTMNLSRLTGRVFVNKMKKGNGVDISMPTAKSEYQDIINLAYAKYPDDDDRLT